MLSPVRKLDSADSTVDFDCGQPALNQYLRRYALMNQSAGMAHTYVCCEGRSPSPSVVAWYSLSVASVEPDAATARLRRGVARHPVPVMLLARLAVDQRWQGRGLGRAMLKDALLRTAQAADIAGIRALLVHAKDKDARRWYLGWDFEPSPTDPYHLFLLLKDIRAIWGQNKNTIF
jgi:GNAT superfamily N-acetyltransferase